MILHNRSHTPSMPGPQKNLWELQATVVPSRKEALGCQPPAAPLPEGLSINPGGLIHLASSVSNSLSES